MSWSVARTGKTAAVAAKLAEDFASNKCVEPEETIKNIVATAVATALGAFPPDTAVRVEAAGSQWGGPTQFQNSLSVKIEPIQGFVE